MRKIITNFILLLVVVMMCASCDEKVEFNDYKDYLYNSMESVKTITNNAKAYDSSILVYEYNNQMSLLENGSAEVVKTITSLNNNFELETKTEKSVLDNVQRNSLLNINFNRDLMDNLNVSDNKIIFTLTPENIKNFLNSNELNISGDAQCELIFADEKINNIKLAFATASHKDVVVNISYLY